MALLVLFSVSLVFWFDKDVVGGLFVCPVLFPVGGFHPGTGCPGLIYVSVFVVPGFFHPAVDPLRPVVGRFAVVYAFVSLGCLVILNVKLLFVLRFLFGGDGYVFRVCPPFHCGPLGVWCALAPVFFLNFSFYMLLYVPFFAVLLFFPCAS